MQFVVGVLLFTCIAGWVDHHVPWPVDKKLRRPL
jgi:hypothetical protein